MWIKSCISSRGKILRKPYSWTAQTQSQLTNFVTSWRRLEDLTQGKWLMNGSSHKTANVQPAISKPTFPLRWLDSPKMDIFTTFFHVLIPLIITFCFYHNIT